ncbi:MAG: protein phosphatase 2C domain-containing protein [Ruminococcus sp.]|jgi:protein phosphatase|nr:protein phosphatase 2C domain-containing protein [Ruminococcus sp.]
MFIFGYTGAGRKEGQNEDAFLCGKKVIDDNAASLEVKSFPVIAAVADGVSGETSGEVASKAALEVLSGVKINPKTDYAEVVLQVHRFLKMQGTLKGLSNMQTTLNASIFLSEKTGVIVNVGDSRAYLWRDGALSQLTKDQSLAQILFEAGQLSKAQKEKFAHKNVILPALGNMTADPVPDIYEMPELLPGDVILMCTDGFSDFVPTPDAEYIMSLPERLPERLEKLYKRALMGGSKDNITVVGVAV